MNQSNSTGPKITPGDVIYTLFRHKKKILFFLLLGGGAAGALYYALPLPHDSTAKLLIRYVTEAKDFISLDQDSNVVRPGERGRGGDRVMNAELQILNSSDIYKAVAAKLGPRSILDRRADGPPSQLLLEAAQQIASNITIETAGRHSSVITMQFSHSQPGTAQNVLQSVIDEYLQKHIETHRASDSFNNFLLQQTDRLKARLAQTEEDLQRARQRAGVVDLGQAKASLSLEINRVRQAILQTDAELAEYSSSLEAFQQIQSELDEPAPSEADAASEQDAKSQFADLSKAVEEYASLRSSLEALRAREQALSLQFTKNSVRVVTVQNRITETEKKMSGLVEQYPDILSSAIATVQTAQAGFDSAPEIRDQSVRIRALQARAATLRGQLAELREEGERIDEVEIEINELERRKELEETNYKNLVISRESTRLEEDLRASRTNNISVIQSPSLGKVDNMKKIQIAGGMGAGLAAIGLAWAFVVDLLLDRSIKRPTEIQRNLRIPLFMSLPDLSDKRYRKRNRRSNRTEVSAIGKSKILEASKSPDKFQPKSATLQAAAISQPEIYGAVPAEESKEISPWDEKYPLSEHFEALRDRVITYFESKNLVHKPKLIGMTGLGERSGVSTIASGLAGSLSKVGEGNVLLVDMTLGSDIAQQFYKGKSVVDLDEVLDGREEESHADGNLYVVAEGTGGTKLPRIMPQRFNKIMPKLRASDFDYIVFDLPPVSTISSTPRLATFMDVVLLVMESEETNRDVANQALDMLSESKAHLGGILNKAKSHVPRKLEQDLLSQA